MKSKSKFKVQKDQEELKGIQKAAFYIYDQRLSVYHKLMQPNTDNEEDYIPEKQCPEVPNRITSIHNYLGKQLLLG